MAHKYKPAAAQKTTARNRKQLHGTENSCTEQKAAARNRKLRHGTENCCTEQKIRLLRGINTRIPATRNTLSPTARNTLSPRADIAAARHRKLLQHGTFGNILLRGTESCCSTERLEISSYAEHLVSTKYRTIFFYKKYIFIFIELNLNLNFIEIYTIAEVHTVFCSYTNLTNLD